MTEQQNQAKQQLQIRRKARIEYCQKRTDYLRKVKRKGKQKSSLIDNMMEDKDHYQTLLLNHKESQLIKQLDSLPLKALTLVTLTQNSMGSRLLIDIISNMNIELLQFINVRLGKQVDVLRELKSCQKEEQNSIVHALIISTISIHNKNNKFMDLLLRQFLRFNSLFSQLFANVNILITFQRMLFKSKSIIQITQQFLKVISHYYTQKQPKQFAQFLNHLKIEKAWKQIRFQPGCDQIKGAVLEQLKYNYLHCIADNGDYKQFMKCLEGSTLTLVNMLNISNETPLDIALRKFRFEEIQELIYYVSKNPSVQLSYNSLNKILQNKMILNSQKHLKKTIDLLKSLTTKHPNQTDNFTLWDQLLKRSDSYQQYPLLKYIRYSKNHNEQIIKTLLFQDLKKGIETLQNEIVNRVYNQILQQFQQNSLKDKLKLYLFSKSITIKQFFPTLKFQQVLSSALKCSEKIFRIILQYLIDAKQKVDVGMMFLSNQNVKKDFSAHLLVVLLKKGTMGSLVEKLIYQLFNKTKLQYPKLNYVPSVKFTQDKQIEVCKRFDQMNNDFNLINQLLYQFFKLEVQNNQTILLKQQLKKYYLNNTKWLFSYVLRNNERQYAINLSKYFLTNKEIIEILKNARKQSLNHELFKKLTLQNPDFIDAILSSPNRRIVQLFLEDKIQCPQNKQKFSSIVALFINSYQKKSEALDYYNTLIQNENVKFPLIKTVFQIQKGELVDYLFLKKGYNSSIINFALQKATEYPLKFIQNILKNKKNIFQMSSNILAPIIKIKDKSKYVQVAQNYGRIGIDTCLVLSSKKQFIKDIKASKLSTFQKNVFYRIVKENKSYFQSIFASDDQFIEQVLPYFKNELCLFRFYSLPSGWKDYNFQLQFQRCNYFICIQLQLRLKQFGFSRKSVQNSLPHIFKILNNYLQNRFIKRKYQQFNEMQYSNFSNFQFADRVFKSIYDYYYKNRIQNLRIESIDPEDEKYQQQRQDLKYIIRLFGKISEQLRYLIKPKQYLLFETDFALFEAVGLIGIIKMQKILQIFKQITKKYVSELRGQLIGRCIFSDLIGYKQNPDVYKQFLNYFKKNIPEQQFNKLRFYCFKQHCLLNPYKAYEYLMEQMPTLGLFQNKEYLSLNSRFNGHSALTLTLLFISPCQGRTFTLVKNNIQSKYKSDRNFVCSLNQDYFEQYIDCALKVVSLNKLYLPRFKQICINASPSLTPNKLKILLNKVLNDKHCNECFEPIIQSVFECNSKLKAKNNLNLSTKNKILFNAHQLTQDQNQVHCLMYQESKKRTKAIQKFSVLKSLFIFNKMALLDFNPISISISELILVLQINILAEGLSNFIPKIIKQEAQDLLLTKQTKQIQKSVVKILFQWKQNRVSSKQITTLCTNIAIIKTFLSQLQFSKFLSHKIKYMLLYSSQHPDVSILLESLKMNYSKKHVVCQVLSFQLINQQVFKDSEFRTYLIKYGKRQNVSKLIKYFTQQDYLNILLHSNSIQILKQYLNSLFNGQIKKKSIIQQLYEVLENCSENYIIDLIESFNLSEIIIKQKTLNIFSVIIKRRLTALLSYLIKWSKNNSIFIEQYLKSVLSMAIEQNFYEIRFLQILKQHFKSNFEIQFNSSNRFLQISQVQNALEIYGISNEFRKKLEFFKKIRNTMNQQSLLGVEKINYSFEIHKIFLNIIFGFRIKEQIVHQNGNQIEEMTENIITASKIFLVSSAQTMSFHNSFFVVMGIYFSTFNAKILKKLEILFPNQVQIVKIFFEYFQNYSQKLGLNKKQLPITILNRHLPKQSKLVQFIFSHYSDSIIQQPLVHLVHFSKKYLHLLLYDFNILGLRSKIKQKFKEIMLHLKNNHTEKHQYINIITWCCYPNLEMSLDDLLSNIKNYRTSPVGSILSYLHKIQYAQSAKQKINKTNGEKEFKQVITFLPSSLKLSEKFMNEIIFQLFKIQDKHYFRLSLISIYLYLKELITVLEQKTQQYYPNINVFLCLNIYSVNCSTKSIQCKTSISLDTVVRIQSEILEKCSELEKFTFLSQNKQQILNKIQQKIKAFKIQKVFWFETLSLSLYVNYQSFQAVPRIQNMKQIFCLGDRAQKLYGILRLDELFLGKLKHSQNIQRSRSDPLTLIEKIQEKFIFSQCYPLKQFGYRNIEIKYLQQEHFKPILNIQNKLILEDIIKYNIQLRNYLDKRKNTQQFNNTIYYSIVNKSLKISTLNCSIINIALVIQKFNLFLNKSFKQINFKKSQILQKIEEQNGEQNKELRRQQSTTFTHIQIGFNLQNFISFVCDISNSEGVFEILTKVLKNQNLINLTQIAVSQLVNQANDQFILNLKGIRFQNKIVEKCQGGILIFLNPLWIVHQISYEISKSKQYIIIYLHSSVSKQTNQKARWCYQPERYLIVIEQFVQNFDFINSKTESDENYARRLLNDSKIKQDIAELIGYFKSERNQIIQGVQIDYKSLGEVVSKYRNRGINKQLLRLSQNLIPLLKRRLEQFSDSFDNHDNSLCQKIYSIKHPELSHQRIMRYSQKQDYLEYLDDQFFFNQILYIISNTFLILTSLSFVYKVRQQHQLQYLVIMEDNTTFYTTFRYYWDDIDKCAIKYVFIITKQLYSQDITPYTQLKGICVVSGKRSLCLIKGMLQYLYKTKSSYDDLFNIIPKKLKVVFTEDQEQISKNKNKDTIYYLFEHDYIGSFKGFTNHKPSICELTRQTLEPLIFSFIQKIKLKTEVVVNFDSNPQIQTVFSRLKDKMELIEQVLLRLMQSPQLQCIEDALIILDHNRNLKQSWMVNRKIQILQSFVKQIHFIFTKEKRQPQIINHNQLKFYLYQNNFQEQIESLATSTQSYITQQLRLLIMSQYKIEQNQALSVDDLILCQIQHHIVQLVRILYPKFNYNIKKSKRPSVSCSKQEIQISFNNKKIVSFFQIISMIENVEQNERLIQYDGFQVQLDGKWRRVDKIIVVPLLDKTKFKIQRVCYQNVSSFKMMIPDNSLFIVIGAYMSWNITHLKKKFIDRINSFVDSDIKIYVDLKNKEYQVEGFSSYEFICNYQKPYSKNINKKKVQKSSTLVEKATRIVFVTRNVVKITFREMKACVITLKCSQKTLSKLNKVFQVTVYVQSQHPSSVQNTKYIGVIPLVIDNTSILTSGINRFANNNQTHKIVEITKNKKAKKKILFSQQSLPTSNKNQITKQQVIQNLLKKPYSFSCPKQQFKYLSKAGDFRIDIISLRDKNGNPVKYNHKRISFQYINDPLLEIIPQIQIIRLSHLCKDHVFIQEQLHLSWKPLIRGVYNLIIDGQIVPTSHKIAVSSNQLDQNRIRIRKINSGKQSESRTNSQQLIESDKSYPIDFEKYVKLIVICRDVYGNIFGDIERAHFYRSVDPIQVTCNDLGFRCSISKISQDGQMVVQFKIFKSGLQIEKKIDLVFLYKKKMFKKLSFLINGKNLNERKKMFEQQLEKQNKPKSKQLQISRQHFLQELLILANQNLNYTISIFFKGQNGTDAGGLKREFYDIIGSTMKDKNNNFLISLNGQRQQYMLSNKLIKNKNKKDIFRCFGKFLVNSILNGYLIGVELAECIVNILYGFTPKFQDLKQIMSVEEFKNYQDLFLYKAQELLSLELTFVDMETGQDLKSNGKYTPLSIDNIKQYIDCVTKFRLITKFEQIYKAFLDGFNEVFSFKLVQKYFEPSEFYTLTSGNSFITPNLLIDLLVYEYPNLIQNEWLQKYLRQVPQKNLKKFLKFISGSSSLPYDLKSNNRQMHIIFFYLNEAKEEQRQKLQNLPIAHTCMFTLKAPRYKSYQKLKERFDLVLELDIDFGFR